MSDEHLTSVLSRAKNDLDFSGKLFANFDGALRDAGFDLTNAEKEKVRRALMGGIPPTPELGLAPSVEDMEYRRKKERERVDYMMKRAQELGDYTVKVLKDTLDHATSTYKGITLMNKIMFFTGIVMFVGGSASALLYKDRTLYSLMFAGLGTVNFISLFLVGAIEKTQVALSNLVQVEVAFMTFFEQIGLWENFALIQKGTPPMPDPANIEKASMVLQQRSQEIIELLQVYVENPPESRKSRPKKYTKAEAARGEESGRDIPSKS